MIICKIRMIGVLTLAILLQGCHTFYVEPRSGSTAKMRFVSIPEGVNVGVSKYKPNSCTNKDKELIAILSGIAGQHVNNRKKLDMPLKPLIDEKNYTETTIAAENPFVFSMSRDASFVTGNASFTNYCMVTASFDPKINGMYEATYTRSAGNCSVSAFEIIKDGDNYRRELIKVQQLDNFPSQGGKPGCVAP